MGLEGREWEVTAKGHRDPLRGDEQALKVVVVVTTAWLRESNRNH